MERTIPELTPEQRAEFIATLKRLAAARVPFRHQGRTLKGLDCLGTPVWALNAVGVATPGDRIDYGRLPARRKLAESLEAALGPPVHEGTVDIAQLQPGDIVTMQWGSEEAHVATIVDHPEGLGIVHAHVAKQCVIFTRLDELIARNIYGVYRP